jgi:hypothetical protein
MEDENTHSHVRVLRTDLAKQKLENVDQNEASYAMLSNPWLADEGGITHEFVYCCDDRVLAKTGWQRVQHCKEYDAKDGLE